MNSLVLAVLVIIGYSIADHAYGKFLARRKQSIIYSAIPMAFMVFMTGWAMLFNIRKYFASQNWLLPVIGVMVFALEIWIIAESAIVLKSDIKSMRF